METKMFEIRDRATFMPVLATKMISDQPAEHYLCRRLGFGEDDPLIMVTRITDSKSQYASYAWGDRTCSTAHKYIEEHFDELETGAVVDVEYILGETGKRKESEKYGGV